MAKNGTKAPRGCEKYELAITNYVLGEKIQMPKGELFNHLRKCSNCQADLKDWQATYGVMRAEAYDSKPEVKARSEAFIKKLVNQPLPWDKPIHGKKPISSQAVVGTVAGAIWRHLAKNGWVKVDDLSPKLKVDPDATKFAVGWLAREDKVYLTQKKQTTYVCLTPPEREIYRAGAQV